MATNKSRGKVPTEHAEPPIPPGAHVIRDTVSTHPPQKDSIIAIAIPMVTSKGRAMIELHSASYLDWQQVRDLHSFLTQWIVDNKHLKDRAIPMFSDVPKKEMH